MKISKIIKKDLRLFRRDTKTLILVILAPVLILSILGIVFGESATSKSISGISIGLCNLNDKPLDSPQLTLYKFKNIKGSDCNEKAKELVEKGQLKAAIVIPVNFSSNIEQGHGEQIILYLDNSRPQTALVIRDAVKAIVQDLNEKIGTEFIENAWTRLRTLNENLKLIIVHLETAKASAIELQNKANNINNNLDKINEKQLDQYLETINNTFGKLNPNLTINLTPKINIEIENLRTIYTSTCNSEPLPLQCTLINSSIINLESINNKLLDYENNLNNALNLTNISRLSEQIETIKQTKANAKQEIINLNSTIYNYTNNIILIVTELNETSQLLDIYTNRDPKTIIRPVTLSLNEIFSNKTYFAFLAPGLILVLLLFTTLLIVSSNIVEEKKRGTLARTLLSPIKIPTLLISKTIYFLILCIIEIIAMFIVTFLFGVTINFSLSLILILLLTSINFIAIGLLIGSISNTENTSLLTSLVLALPMFFLSNLLFPLEIMPSVMKSIGTYMPLTLAITNLDRAITYLIDINFSHISLLIIYPFIICVITYFIIKRKPTSQ